MSSDQTPKVSVIIPAYNEEETIRSCLESVSDQSYQNDRYEIIVVDNGSSDDTYSLARRYSDLALIENENKGSYSARNRGLEAATGDIITFTDADCEPSKDWIKNGVTRLQESNASLAAGKVEFVFSRDETAAERFDASVHMQQEQNVQEGVAATANLFVRDSVICELGVFPTSLLSGGDMYWTSLATENGFKLVYAPNAVVKHPARKWRSLLSKQYRIGKGQIEKWRLDGDSIITKLLTGFIKFPINILHYLSTNQSNVNGSVGQENEEEQELIKFYLIAGLSIIIVNMGRMIGIYEHYFK